MILCPALLAALVAAAPVSRIETRPLMDLREPRALDAWRPLHDGVMGGVSSGSAAATADGARFDGRLSLENNGGFASFRADVT